MLVFAAVGRPAEPAKRYAIMPNVFGADALPVAMKGNLYIKGAIPNAKDLETQQDIDTWPELGSIRVGDNGYIHWVSKADWKALPREIVTAELLGIAEVPDLPFGMPDGSPVHEDRDCLGHNRDEHNPIPGPFECTTDGAMQLEIWKIYMNGRRICHAFCSVCT